MGRLRNRLEEVFIDLNSVAVTCVLVLAFLLLVTLATLSRGGILGCLAACVVTLCLTLGGRGANYSTAAALAVTMLALVGGVLTLLQLNEPIYSRLDQIDTALQSGKRYAVGGLGLYTECVPQLLVGWLWIGYVSVCPSTFSYRRAKRVVSPCRERAA